MGGYSFDGNRRGPRPCRASTHMAVGAHCCIIFESAAARLQRSPDKELEHRVEASGGRNGIDAVLLQEQSLHRERNRLANLDGDATVRGKRYGRYWGIYKRSYSENQS